MTTPKQAQILAELKSYLMRECSRETWEWLITFVRAEIARREAATS